MNASGRIAKNTVALVSSDIISKILTLGLSIYVARYLGVENFGIYTFAFSFILLFSVFSDIGVNNLVIREVARDKASAGKYLGSLIYLKLMLSFASFFLIVVVINLLDYPSSTKLIVYIVGLWMIVQAIVNMPQAIFNAFEKMEYNALIVIVGRVLVVVFGFSILLLGYGLVELALVFLATNILTAFLAIAIALKKFVRPNMMPDLVFMRNLLKNALPLGFASIFFTIYLKIDSVMLSVMKGDAAVGWYAAAYNLTFHLSLLPTMFAVALFPAMSNLFKRSESTLIATFENSFRYVLIVMLPVVAGIIVLSDSIILTIYGTQYEKSISALQILSLALLFASMNSIFLFVLPSIDKQIVSTKITGVGAFSSIILNLILIPKFSFIGASVATVLTGAIMFFLNYYYISRFLTRLNFYSIGIRPLIAVTAMAVFLFYLKELNLLLLISASALLYFSIFYFIGGFSEEDKRLIGENIIKPVRRYLK